MHREFPVQIRLNTIIAAVMIVGGIIIRYVIRQRNFNLRVMTGLQGFCSYERAWFAVKKQFKLHKELTIRSYIVTVAFLISGFVYKIPFVQQLSSFEEVTVPLFWMG